MIEVCGKDGLAENSAGVSAILFGVYRVLSGGYCLFDRVSRPANLTRLGAMSIAHGAHETRGDQCWQKYRTIVVLTIRNCCRRAIGSVRARNRFAARDGYRRTSRGEERKHRCYNQ
jgi:hypothetical protein